MVSGRLARIRLWRDGAPLATYLGRRCLERCVSPVNQLVEAPSCSVAIEAWVPMGPRALYGLLGVRYVTGAADCEIHVPVIDGLVGANLSDSIAASHDEVRIGLPYEYGVEVAERLAQAAETLGVRGKLFVEHAAHSLTGSSTSVFGGLSDLVVRMITERLEEADPRRVEAIVRAAICGIPSP